ncbi:N-methyl-L-tryptophan oxidase [Streptomyces stelliscabiei]|uniref:Sarcosine oxidase n=2 Tax=Streptomyces stelliscabiei TaxID=146820 RepID=A0A8I0PK35_9ACTN|nr:N-methyl-L-tryptophan oxidase [Streptomyces stelliscabiei]MBE1602883.1 sarcosine oxidase [Streptomyces stelliscabiei]MDX2521902.1 N-methyl-L-tryptophan oxidase [Streptomyces stelliscabiei]
MSTAKKRVAVVGVGTMGSQAAWRLAARGAEVVGYDRFAPGHDRSAAGGESRVFRSAHFEDSRYVPLLKHADSLWEQLQQETGRELRRLTGCLLMGPTEQQQMATVLESIAEHGLDHEVLDAELLAKRFPQYRLEDGDAAVLDRRAGLIRPELTVQTAARRAEQLGAVIHRYTPVREITPVSGGVEVRTDAGSERFDAAVVTPGPWVNDLLPGLPWEVEIRRLISAWFVPTTPGAWFGEERPAFIRTAPTHCYGLPSPDGVSVKLGLSQYLHKPAGDPNALDRTVQPGELEIYAELIGRYLPDLHPDPTRLSVFMEGYTESSRPLVGPLPGAENIVVLAGFSGHGFKLSPAFGDIAAGLALDGTSPQPIDFISTVDRTAA